MCYGPELLESGSARTCSHSIVHSTIPLVLLVYRERLRCSLSLRMLVMSTGSWLASRFEAGGTWMWMMMDCGTLWKAMVMLPGMSTLTLSNFRLQLSLWHCGVLQTILWHCGELWKAMVTLPGMSTLTLSNFKLQISLRPDMVGDKSRRDIKFFAKDVPQDFLMRLGGTVPLGTQLEFQVETQSTAPRSLGTRRLKQPKASSCILQCHSLLQGC